MYILRDMSLPEAPCSLSWPSLTTTIACDAGQQLSTRRSSQVTTPLRPVPSACSDAQATGRSPPPKQAASWRLSKHSQGDLPVSGQACPRGCAHMLSLSGRNNSYARQLVGKRLCENMIVRQNTGSSICGCGVQRGCGHAVIPRRQQHRKLRCWQHLRQRCLWPLVQ